MTMAARVSSRPKMTVHQTLLMTKETLERLRMVAAREGRTVSDVIRRFIDSCLDAQDIPR